MEDRVLRNRISGMIAIYILALMTLISFGLAQEASSPFGNQTANEVNDAAIASDRLNNTTAAIGSNQSALVNVQGVWKFSLAGKDILMALNQSRETLFGSAKYEADKPWNGVVAGSLSGNVFSISLAAMEDGMQASTYMSGTVQGDSMKGSYIWSDSRKSNSGELAAIMISPDISIYTPSTIEAISEPERSEQEPKISTEQEPVEPAVLETKSRFRDVTDLAKGINPNIMPRMAPI
jgi:hypothetical protein